MRAFDGTAGGDEPVPDGPPRALVLAAWAAATVALGSYVARYGTSMAMLDDLAMVGELGPNGDLGLVDLWAQHNEHRIPLPKAVYVLAVDAARDFRAGTWITVALLSAAALALITGARALRGRQSPADLAFPALLLHWGHWENTLNSFNVCFTIPVVVSLAAALLVQTSGERPPAGRVALLGSLLLLQPLCGLVGLIQVPGLACWLAWVGARARRAGETPVAVVAAASIAAVVALCAVYFAGFRFLAGFRAPSLDRALVTSLQFLAQGLGSPAEAWWPWSAVATAGVALGAMVALAVRAARRPERRVRALGLAASIAGVLALAASVGWGRAVDGETAGYCNRYGLLSAPILCFAALARASGRPAGRTSERVAAAAVGLASLGLWAANVEPAVAYGRERVAAARALEADVVAGVPLARVARDHWRSFYYGEDDFHLVLTAARAARLGPFRAIPHDEPDALSVLSTRPSSWFSPQPFSARVVAGRPVVIAPAGSEIAFAASAGARLRASYGLYPYAVERGRSDGLVVRVAWRAKGGAERVLFERRLDPRAPGDGGLHELELDLPAEAGGLLLRVDDEPGRVERHDWACWGGVALEPPPP